jgi:general secretion pathway protein N
MSATNKKFRWWIFAILSFVFFVLLQVPASWLVAKFYTSNQNLYNVSGNIWQGQADWQQRDLQGTVAWKIRPWELLRLRTAAHIKIHSGQTQLDGVMAYSLGKTLYIQNLNGTIAPETLAAFAAGQWPQQAIQVKDIDLKYKKTEGFKYADGQLHWLGGEMRYRFGERQELIQIPNLQAKLVNEQQKMIVDVRDNREQKMLNIVLDPNLMMDIQITQRMLMNAPSYQGQAALDSYVLSTRQPLLQGGS